LTSHAVAKVSRDELKLLIHHYTVEKIRWSAEEPAAIEQAEQQLHYWSRQLEILDEAVALGDVW
jgi:hypothetical protein